jgi:hypothetical protein
MAKHPIVRKNGTPTNYYWSDSDGSDRTSRTVYKQTTDGVKRMKGVSFNAETGKLKKG